MKTTALKSALSSNTPQTVSTRLAKARGKWIGWALITIVIFYVSILIIAPLAALTMGAFEQGVGAIIEAFQDEFILIASLPRRSNLHQTYGFLPEGCKDGN